jgi:hypothetical protein
MNNLNRRLLLRLQPLWVAVLVVACASGASPSRPPIVAGGPDYQWNQPFLDWPQTGDLACETENGPCATPLPTPNAAQRAQGRALHVPQIEVPVGDVGRHEADLGQLVFPNGVHTRTFFKIANGDESVFRVSQTHVEFRSLESGAPAFTEFARDRAPRPGPERVTAVLVWDVAFAKPGAVMIITDLVVE